MDSFPKVAAFLCLFLLVACSGGDTPTTPDVPQEAVLTTLIISLSESNVAEGRTVTATASGRDQRGAAFAPVNVTWSVSNPEIAAVDGSGTVSALLRGSTNIVATAGTVTGQASFQVTPAPIEGIESNSSYAIARENARASMLDWRSFPEDGPMKTARGVTDLDGDGTPDVFLAAGIFLEESPTIPVRFFKGSAGGTFTDVTDSWLVGAAPGMLSARKVIFGDFNADGVPDPFTCAHGYDADPFPGTTNLLLLSGGGRWSVANQAWTSTIGFYHGCASADTDNDGDLDLIVLDSKFGSYFLLNDGTGSFTVDKSGLPASLQKNEPVFSTELIDVDLDGFIDLVVGGDEVYQQTAVFWGNGTGTFADGRSSKIPALSGWPNVTTLAAEDLNGDGVREVVVGRSNGSLGDDDFYTGFRVQVASLSNRAFTDATTTMAGPANQNAAEVLLDYKDDPKWIEWMWVSDYDGDGLPDLIGSDGYTGSYLALNQGGVLGPWVKK